ncbi:hypothetical protein ScalyP_jg11936 [Parmales sp. scaly parma]|nr:hypothetical protein ScalyP_jg11936 [Parmales sp. scaly parma]
MALYLDNVADADIPISDDQKDLIEFLSQTDRTDIQKVAADAAAALTASANSIAIKVTLIKGNIVKPLLRLLSSKSLMAIKALINLSCDCHNGMDDMLNNGAVNRIIEMCRSVPFEGFKLSCSEYNDPVKKGENPDSVDHDIINNAMILLANLTRFDEGAVLVMRDDGAFLTHLMARFLESKADVDPKNDRWQHVSTILMNVTQLDSGRRFVLKISTGVLVKILPEIRSKNVVRRRGICGTIKNVCFDKESCYWLLMEVGILQHVLYPLVGPEEIDLDDRIGMDPSLWLEGDEKVREEDEQVKLMLVETLLGLCASGRRNREYMRSKQTYPILKMLDLVEESEQVSEKISDCVNYVRRDEEGKDGEVDKVIKENMEKVKQVIKPLDETVSYDNVD